MPVTAALSKKFYEKFGEDVTNELVNWFNTVDATYRADLRELNELNFGRFDAKLGERLAELDAKWRERCTQLDTRLEQRTSQLDTKLEQRLAQLNTEFSDRLHKTEIRLAGLTIAWVPTVLGIFEFLFRR